MSPRSPKVSVSKSVQRCQDKDMRKNEALAACRVDSYSRDML